MKKLNTFRAKACNKISVTVIASILLLITQSAYAQTGTKSLDVFIGMQYGLSIIIPISAAIILLFLLLIYLFRIIARATFMRWAFSVIIAGAAFYISHILFNIQ
ncbi:putative membrane protein [Bartonella fuyuanensis]|uniref:Putative membrane protein n=1 Tax=Bartonella fuyuanensis TaxID=1460968 RepID=A0A840DS30_9HYPH|nr:conjugal transfer protein [Bartonella fuyuanensis]MBB4075780.1 putative membrane protein [Bartonella fuyuanensis]